MRMHIAPSSLVESTLLETLVEQFLPGNGACFQLRTALLALIAPLAMPRAIAQC